MKTLFCINSPTAYPTNTSVGFYVGPRPQLNNKINDLTNIARRSFLQITRPQRDVAGDLQKRREKNKTKDTKANAVGGGLDLKKLRGGINAT